MVRNDPAITADTVVAGIVTAYKNLVSPLANSIIGAITTDLPNSRTDGACNMPAGELIADSQLAGRRQGLRRAHQQRDAAHRQRH